MPLAIITNEPMTIIERRNTSPFLTKFLPWVILFKNMHKIKNIVGVTKTSPPKPNTKAIPGFVEYRRWMPRLQKPYIGLRKYLVEEAKPHCLLLPLLSFDSNC